VAYKVVFLKGNESVRKANWADRESAIAYATRDLPFLEQNLSVTAVYVVDVTTNQVIFVLPAASDQPPT
jgi:hypothetical protein